MTFTDNPGPHTHSLPRDPPFSSLLDIEKEFWAKRGHAQWGEPPFTYRFKELFTGRVLPGADV